MAMMSTRPPHASLLRLLPLIAWAGVVVVQLAHAELQVTLGAITKAWADRQDKVVSAKFSWKEHRVHPKGTLGDGREAGDAKPVTTPANDVAFDLTHTLTFDGAKMRYTWKGKVWNSEGSGVVDQDYVGSFNGLAPKVLWPRGATGHPVGTIMQGKKLLDVNQLQNLPLLMTYRAMHSTMGLFDPKEFMLSDRQGIVSGRKCVLLKQVNGGAITYWVDAENHYLMRYATEKDGKTGIQIDLSYTPHPDYGQVLSGWRAVVYGVNGRLTESSESQVTDYSINLKIPDDEFELEFPPGTRVSDLTTPSDIGDYTDYIVRKNGEKRAITADENLKATYEQLVNTDSGKALAPHWLLSKWIIGGNLALLASMLAYAAWRLWSKRASRKQTG
jgi:hypothetical protein